MKSFAVALLLPFDFHVSFKERCVLYTSCLFFLNSTQKIKMIPFLKKTPTKLPDPRIWSDSVLPDLPQYTCYLSSDNARTGNTLLYRLVAGTMSSVLIGWKFGAHTLTRSGEVQKQPELINRYPQDQRDNLPNISPTSTCVT